MFYGYQIGMARQDILCCVYGTFIDMISCLAIFNGRLKQKRKAKKMSFEEAINLR